MNIAFIVDPLHKLKAHKDSSIAMMRAAAARGHAVSAIQRETLSARDGVVSALAVPLTVRADNAHWYDEGPAEKRALNSFDAVLMRQDPPFDAEYVAATWLLERAVAQGARVYNDPRAIRDHSEKVSILEFPQFTPTTLVARDADDIDAFIDELGDVILKPLDGMGGSGIFRVRHDDPNRNAIIEALTGDGTRSIMAQRYLPQIAEGDKRVLLIGGEVMPYCLARIPKAGETRGNLAAGGRGVVMPINAAEREIAMQLAPVLWARGLLIVGLDMIGGRLTEINVTSPTCMVEIAQGSNLDIAGRVIDVLAGRA
ncbi:glutathione synthase [Viridibacterium curvum]|uniref:Glutathione synthetase n=1 Tax=Viridibacterium curvum TaxID=1101404 RepID=A0ABP9QQG5_9RHOO